MIQRIDPIDREIAAINDELTSTIANRMFHVGYEFGEARGHADWPALTAEAQEAARSDGWRAGFGLASLIWLAALVITVFVMWG